MREFTYPHTFWLKPVSNFGFSTLTMVITVHLSWPYHPNPRPSPPVAGRFSLSSRFSLQFPAGTSPGSFTQDGYPSCMCRQVSLTEQRVPLTGQFNEATSRRTILIVIQHIIFSNVLLYFIVFAAKSRSSVFLSLTVQLVEQREHRFVE